MEESTEQLKYPIGRHKKTERPTAAHRLAWIQRLEALPAELEAAVQGLTEDQLDTPYRPGGWTVRQLVHHIADSHINAHCRLRLMLTEDAPTIKPYNQDEWVKLADANSFPLRPSLDIVGGVHARWAALAMSLAEQDYGRTYVHPEYGAIFSVDDLLALYAWHGQHHVAHITELRKRMGW